MGDDGGNLEEYMYWSHFKTLQFCHILSGRFHQHLAIPEKFAKKLREKLAGSIVLRGPSGCTWDADMTAKGHNLFLKGGGWKAFVEDHALEENDILIFKYNGSSTFDVLIFDKESFCEKESSYFVKKCATFAGSGCGRGRKKRGKEEATSEQTNNESTSDETNDVAELPVVKKRTRAAPAAVKTPLSMRDAPVTARGRGRGRRRSMKGNQGSTRVVLDEEKPPARVIDKEERERAYRMAVEASSESSFISVMNASNVWKGYYVTIPCEWARKFLQPKRQAVELRLNQKTWQAICYCTRTSSYLCIGYGWRQFVTDNSLQQYDVCLFNFVSASENSFVLDVKIFQVKEGIQPAPSNDHPQTPNGSATNEDEDA